MAGCSGICWVIRMCSQQPLWLLHQIEPFIYSQRKANFLNNGGEDPDAVPLRVTMIYSTDSTMSDMHDVLKTVDNKHPEAQLTFNNKSIADNGGNYREAEIDSADVATTPDVSNGINDLENYPPHLVLAIATREFPASVMQGVEDLWPQNGTSKGVIRPYDLMSHLIYNTVDLTNRTQANFSKTPPLHMRVAGVNYAEAQDPHSKTLYNAYLSTLQQVNTGNALSLVGTENYYDAAYYLLYSIAAAARNNALTSVGRYQGRFHATRHRHDSGSAYSVDVGPSAIQATVGNLVGNPVYSMALWGTMGYPNFNTTLGTRISQTSAWCVQQKDASSTGTYQPDGLVYDATSQTYSPNSSGIPACLQNYCPLDADAGSTTCPQDY